MSKNRIKNNLFYFIHFLNNKMRNLFRFIVKFSNKEIYYVFCSIYSILHYSFKNILTKPKFYSLFL